MEDLKFGRWEVRPKRSPSFLEGLKLAITKQKSQRPKASLPVRCKYSRELILNFHRPTGSSFFCLRRPGGKEGRWEAEKIGRWEKEVSWNDMARMHDCMIAWMHDCMDAWMPLGL